MVAPLHRRQVLLGLVAVGSVGAVAGCASPSSGSAQPSSAPVTPSSGGGGAPGALLSTDQVPVGGGVIVESGGAPYAVTQPVAGTYKCFSAVCPHQGCTCNRVADGTIDCPCHDSRFDIATGAVVQGPAKSPLPAAPITVSGTSITLA